MYEFLALESRAIHIFCEILRVLRSIYAQSPLLYLLNSQVLAADKKFKINKRTNNKWKFEISQFTKDSLAEIY